VDRETENLVLIGMPGAGKSTVGVLLAKTAGRSFVDTDLLIQEGEGRPLQSLLDEKGAAGFQALEERYLRALHVRGAVIATGGSAVYSAAAMDHLRRGGPVVYLAATLPTLAGRLGAWEEGRGVVRRPGQTLADLFAERDPLYRRYAEAVIATDGLPHDAVVRAVLRAVGKSSAGRSP